MDSLAQHIFELVDPIALTAYLASYCGESPHTQAPGLARPSPLKVSDLDVYRALLGPEPVRTILRGSLVEQYALSFALRHRLSELAALAHTATLTTGAAMMLQSRLKESLGITTDELAAAFGTPLPIIGFSSLGLHLSWVETGYCRAFDFYDLQACRAPASHDSPFCAAHQCDAFFCNSYDEQEATKQARMFHFHLDRANLGAYGEDDLSEMLARFLDRLRMLPRRGNPAELEAACSHFGLDGMVAARRLGPSGLRSLFLRQSLVTHPDRGGSAEAFGAARANYELLRNELLLRGA